MSIIDSHCDSLIKNITLSVGAQSAEGVDVSHDGKYAYISHIMSRYGVPVTQLDRGWVNSNAVSVVDLQADTLVATVLIDDVDRGAANPKGISINNSKLFITISGTHELMEIDLERMHQKIDSVSSGHKIDNYTKTIEDISVNLSFLSGIKKRYQLSSLSPQNVVCYEDAVYVSGRFTSYIECLRGNKTEVLKIADEKSMNSKRRGELAFSDASICYQNWQSCESCHPYGRVDALNWDQLNDGTGNPKNTKSMLYSHVTPPSMITGIRESAALAVRKGILHTLGTVQEESLAKDMDNYLISMKPVSSPYLVDGEFSNAAKCGEKLYKQAKCDECHNGKYLTNGLMYDVGTGIEEYENAKFDTPTLREVWRTAPYLYDGRALTMQEVLKEFNKEDKHGITSSMTEQQINDLAEYVLSL